MRKLYAGLAAAAMTATGIACAAGAAHATASPWPSDLGYNADITSIAVAEGGTVYVASTDQDDPATLRVTTTDPAGATTPREVTLATDPGFAVQHLWQVAVSPNGAVVVAGNETDPTNGTIHQELWLVAPGTGTGELVGGSMPSGDALALSPGGMRGVTVGDGQVATFAISGGTLTFAGPVTLDASATALAATITDGGNAYVAGIDPTPTLWTFNGVTLGSEPLTATPDSVAVLGTDAVAVGETDDNQNSSIQFIGGADDGHTLPLADEPDGLATDGQTLWASGRGGGIETIDLGALDSYTGVNPVPSYRGIDSVSGVAYDPSTAALYAVGQTLFDDTINDQWRLGHSALHRFTKPGTVSDPSITDMDTQFCVRFAEPATTDGAPLSYVVTATDRATGQVITVMGSTDENGSATGCFTDDNGNDLLSDGHAYDVTVTADNGGILGDTVAAGSILPSVAAGTATISGTPQVGSTLTAVTSGWPDGTTLAYAWYTVDSTGGFGGPTPIAGANQSTLTITSALAGHRIILGVTGHLLDHADATAWSAIVTVPALAQPAPPATQPVQVTQIKPATIKASAKKIKLTLPGIATVSAPGKVKVYDGKKLIGTAKIVNGKLVVKLKKHLSHGQHKLKLTYPGSAQVAKFTKKANVKVK